MTMRMTQRMQALRGLGSDERRQLATLLERVCANLDSPPP
jgi:hypothetical protein